MGAERAEKKSWHPASTRVSSVGCQHSRIKSVENTLRLVFRRHEIIHELSWRGNQRVSQPPPLLKGEGLRL